MPPSTPANTLPRHPDDVVDQSAAGVNVPGTGTGDFQIKDWPNPGATNTSNFTSAFALQSQADTLNTLSGQIGDIDNALQVTLTRARNWARPFKRLRPSRDPIASKSLTIRRFSQAWRKVAAQ